MGGGQSKTGQYRENALAFTEHVILKRWQQGDPLFQQVHRLRLALAYLGDDTVPEVERLSALLDKRGKHHIRGLGINLVSKILAVHDPSHWPVYNDVVETALNRFGYLAPRGIGMAERYLLYSAEMRKFMKAVGQTDVLALDSFFRWYYEQHLKRRAAKLNQPSGQ